MFALSENNANPSIVKGLDLMHNSTVATFCIYVRPHNKCCIMAVQQHGLFGELQTLSVYS